MLRSQVLMLGLALCATIGIVLAFMRWWPGGLTNSERPNSAPYSANAGTDTLINSHPGRTSHGSGNTNDFQGQNNLDANGNKRSLASGGEDTGNNSQSVKSQDRALSSSLQMKQSSAVPGVTSPQGTQPNLKPDLNKGPTPTSPPASWFGLGDIPPRMRNAGIQASIAYTILVGPDGRVAGCQASETGSTGLADLFCSKVRNRASFDPATDKDGTPAQGAYKSGLKLSIAARANSKPNCQTDAFNALTKGC